MHNITEKVQAVPLETYGGLITLVRPESAPEGASPRNNDMDYLVGSAQTRAPLQNVYSYAAAASGPNAGDLATNVAVTGNAWANPGNILLNGANYATCAPGAGDGGSDALNVTAFAFDLPATVTPTGITIPISGWANSAVTLTAQLLLAGVAVGLPKSLTMPTTPGTMTFGGPSDLWGAAVPFSAVNGVGFGVQLTATSSFAGAMALLNYATVTVNQTTANANFNFITTFVAQNGAVKNLSLDADGNFWLEDVTNNPGTLTLAFDGIAPGSFVNGVNGPGVEYLAFNDLTTGSDLPRSYVAAAGSMPAAQDRISQVGPGAAPVFAASTQAAGAAATITAYAVSSNVVTLTAANTFTAGQAVLFAGLSSAAFLNGQVLVVLGSGLSTSAFRVAFTTANASSTPDSGTATPQTDYPIATITQPAQVVRTFAFGLQSSGPGSTAPGNIITQYYQDLTLGSPDAALVAAFNSGNPVYLYVVLTNGLFPTPATVLVTSLGQGIPPNQARQFAYFTYQVQSVSYALSTGQGGYGLTYQQSLATLTASEPVPLLNVGSQATIAGTSVAGYNSTWAISQALNSATMAITQTSLTAGVATYSYSVVSGANPTAGQLVTITNTLNANGALNGTDLVIASVSGTNTGTFTITGFEATTNYPAESETAQATTAGTQFAFDPGALTLGTTNSPIYGNATGGELIFTGNGQYIAAGTKQGVVFFITRNGYYTAPSPPVTFSVPQNTTAILASQIPIGPPNVIARGIALTESGANGVPGANFFTIPTPVQYIVNGVTYTAQSLFINDNTSTTASFSFTDNVLLEAEAIDVQGNNLFNLIELGNPGWIASYAGRNFYGLCQNKVQNFTNLSFDGGYLPGGQLIPLGWSMPDSYGSLLVSPVFGNSYYIKNSTGSTLATAGLIAQSAYEDAYQQPIPAANTAYSVRLTARAPSGLTVGNLVVALTAGGIVYGSFTVPLASLTTTMQTLTAQLLTAPFATVPSGLQVELYASGLGAAADAEIDRVEIFPTAIPVLSTTVYGSYAGDLESVDAIDGAAQFTGENSQPVNGAVVMFDTFYALKGSSMYSMQSSPGLEPAQWAITEVAQRAGSCGINAYDFGEQWIVEACRNGLYLFAGGQPGKIMQEIYQVWDSINWSAGKSIWVRNDVPNRRLLVGVPLPTPNFWLPNAPVNANPATPNVILMCNYQGIETGEDLKQLIGLHVTMFGSLNSVDMRRKWSIWQIPAPYAAVVSTAGEAYLRVRGGGGAPGSAPNGGYQSGGINLLDGEMRFCNGIASSKVYRLNTELPSNQIPTDDGAAINSLYTTYGFVNVTKASQFPLLGMFRKLWGYLTHQVSGCGLLNLRALPNTLLGPGDSTAGYYPWTLPGGFTLTDPCTQIREAPLNFAATRTFLEFSTTGRMSISNVVMVGKKHPHNELTGIR